MQALEARLRESEAQRQEGEARRRECEERLRQALGAAAAGTWRVDLATGLETRDASFNRLLGLPEEATSLPVQDSLSRVVPEDRPRVEQALLAALAQGQPYLQELRIMRADGEVRWLRDRGGVVPGPDGRPAFLTGAVVDITDMRRGEHEQRTREEFVQQLMGVVSHDLRNPIAAILAAAGSLQRRSDLDARTLKALAVIVSSGERASRLIRDLLDFTRARLEGGLPVTRRALDLHAVVRSAVEEVRLAHPERTFLLSEDGDGSGAWDGDRLAQVVGNLVSNAVAYSPPETPVRVETLGEGREVVLRVHNGGPSIPDALLPHLFAPFRRGEGERRNAAGVGLGLFIVDQLVRAHGGQVTASSTAEAGTLFTVRLPRR